MTQLFRMGRPRSRILGHVATAPPAGTYPVTNVYWDPVLEKMIGEYDNSGTSAGTIVSDPPVGKFAITNIFWDPASGKMTGEFDEGT